MTMRLLNLPTAAVVVLLCGVSWGQTTSHRTLRIGQRTRQTNTFFSADGGGVSADSFVHDASFDKCRMNLLAADADGNNKISTEEYADFISRQSDRRISGDFASLDVFLVMSYYTTACSVCYANTSDDQCCVGADAHIPLLPEDDLQFLVILDFLCPSVDETIAENLPPTPPPVTPPPPTPQPTEPPATNAPVVVVPPFEVTPRPTIVTPTPNPTLSPTAEPTPEQVGTGIVVVSRPPTSPPTLEPTSIPTSIAPTTQPTTLPTASPITAAPTASPTATPTTLAPTATPTTSPTSEAPTATPTATPTAAPQVCVSFAYTVANEGGFSADDIFNGVDNAIVDRLLVATRAVVEDLFSEGVEIAAATIDSIADNPMACDTCVIVASTVCVVSDDEAVRQALLDGLRVAVDGGEFTAAIPADL